MKFKLLGGSHNEEGVTYNKGDVITTHRDLAAKFGKNRFEKLGRFIDADVDDTKQVHQPVIESVHKKNKKSSKKKTKQQESKKEEDVRGLDVTEDFAVAKEAGLTIFEKEHWFTIFDENGVVLNDRKLRKKNVPSFLEEYLAEDEKDIEEEDEDEDETVEEDEDEEPIQFAKDDRVIVEIDDEEYAGTITEIKDMKATIEFDDGDTDTYALDKLVLEGEEDEDED